MRFRLMSLILALLMGGTALAQQTGRIEGTVTRVDGSGLPGVIVVVDGTNAATLTDSNGRFSLTAPAGTHTVLLTGGQNVEVIDGVTVRAGQTVRISREVAWDLSFAETITVYSASREPVRIVEAPAAVTVVAQQDIQLAAPTGQLPSLLEDAPGVDYAQSGLYDINFNARGFNSSLNRRILTLIDGRDPSVPFLGAQEWAAVSFPIDLMASVEFVRGPGSALYGANAYNGVLNMVTFRPGDNPGGKFALTGGDLSTLRADLHHAGSVTDSTHYRIVGGYLQSDDFTRSRNTSVEYAQCPAGTPTGTPNCLPREAVPLVLTENEIMFTGLRLDHDFSGNLLTLEGGYASIEGPTFQTGIGRVQTTDVARPWARGNFSTDNLNALVYWDGRKADNQVALASNARLYEDSSNLHGELQGNVSLFDGRARVIGGVSYTQEDVDTANPQGFQTLMASAKDEDMQAVFAQMNLDVTDSLRLVVAGRYDDSSLHESQFSPKASLVYSLTPNHSLRLTYNEAFQVPNYSEFFLRAPAAAPINLSAFEAAFGLPANTLGFASIPILALGNDDLIVEEITSYEAGYAGIIGSKLFLTLDYYQNRQDNFVTDLLPGVNPNFAPYAPPGFLPPALQAALLGALQANLPARVFAGFTNLPDGSPAVVFSYTNAGKVETEGFEVAANFYLTNQWVLDANFSWFDYEVVEAAPDLLFPNAAERKINVGLSYRGLRWDGSLSYRWVGGNPGDVGALGSVFDTSDNAFIWATGVFIGVVPSFDVLSLAGSYRVNDALTIGANIHNLADSDHYESFGGDRLGRRALGFVSYSW